MERPRAVTGDGEEVRREGYFCKEGVCGQLEHPHTHVHVVCGECDAWEGVGVWRKREREKERARERVRGREGEGRRRKSQSKNIIYNVFLRNQNCPLTQIESAVTHAPHLIHLQVNPVVVRSKRHLNGGDVRKIVCHVIKVNRSDGCHCPVGGRTATISDGENFTVDVFEVVAVPGEREDGKNERGTEKGKERKYSKNGVAEARRSLVR